MTRSRVIRETAFRWQGVEPHAYKDVAAHHRGVTRHTLLGGEGRDPALDIETRYFEVEPGGFTTLERHAHPHAVVVLRGRGEVVLDSVVESLTPFDVIYVAPWTTHQLRAATDGVLGFLCVVPRERDRPQPVADGAE